MYTLSGPHALLQAPFAQQSPPIPPVALTELEHHLSLRERMRAHQEQLAQLEHMRMQQFHAVGGYFYPQGQPPVMMQQPEWREQGASPVGSFHTIGSGNFLSKRTAAFFIWGAELMYCRPIPSRLSRITST